MRERKTDLLPSDQARSESQLWVIIYTDMMTNLMLFFLMLWGLSRMSFSSYKQAIYSLQATVTKKEVRAQLPEQQQNLVSGKFDMTLKTKADLQGIRIMFDSPILFDLGSASLKEKAIGPLSQIAKWLSDVPYTVIVEGYTDNTPIKTKEYSSNWQLSLDRARSVIKYLESTGIDKKRLVLSGYGEYHPLYENDTAQHRALNRRIELYVVYWEK